jgi:hypothetical protein
LVENSDQVNPGEEEILEAKKLEVDFRVPVSYLSQVWTSTFTGTSGYSRERNGFLEEKTHEH